ncbi:MAG TPA: hypothetical protein VFY14_05435 [Streptomyces sp.]|nr:hypothetical protein [Streptomyces sp.]
MSSSDPNNPYSGNPHDDPPGQPHDQPPDRPQAPPPGPYGAGAGEPMPGKVNSSRLIFFVTGGIQAVFSLLALITFAAAKSDLEETYGELGVNTGLYYTLFALFLVHAVIGIVLAARFPRSGNVMRIWSIVWAALLVLVGLATLPLGLLWIILGVVCVVLLSSAESTAWFNRSRS